MSKRSNINVLKQALLDAGFEIYQTDDAQIRVAERVRLHMMDSGVRIEFARKLRVIFTARSQKSDFPNDEQTKLFDLVRGSVGALASERGYTEASADCVEVRDPSDKGRILDVWHEVTYQKSADDLDALISEVEWALQINKHVLG